MTRRFDTILVANRGEIACRVIRTANEEGYRTVAVYSDADAGALHVKEADEAVYLGPSPAAQSYLSIEKVIDAAKKSGAQAIHPGYGFLSENRAFAEACTAAGITFIGPPATAIHALGNKAEAKRLVQKAGVPCVPGYNDTKQDDATLKAAAKKIGFPVLLKAAAGGGGRGMRRVNSEAELDEALKGARSEGKNSFGSDELIVEKLIENARHVEIQILADEHGNCIHLGERDCSVQRRHQKVIEESPCPAMTPELRAAMGAAAVNAAKAAGYVNAGTVEFLLDDDGKFYFLEVNTRLQVEHPVTEMVTDLDLVELQLRIAQGESLPIEQSDVTFDGHAIEVRLCAEDPAAGFAPQVGTIHRWLHPHTYGLRIDGGIGDGTEISPFYDSLLAKIIVFGESRPDALQKLGSALRDTGVLGVRTNLSLLQSIVGHPVFAGGEARTNFIDTSNVIASADEAPSALQRLIAAVAFIEHDSHSQPGLFKGWRSTGTTTVSVRLECSGSLYLQNVSMNGRRYRSTGGDETVELEVYHFDGRSFGVAIDGRSSVIPITLEQNVLYMKYGGRTDTFIDLTYAAPETSAAAADGVIKAPIVGQVVRVNVQTGAAVAKGDVLVVIEAMKMENQIVAPCDGDVEAVSVAVGDQVDANQILVKLIVKAEA